MAPDETYDPKVWSQLVELGRTGLAVPEQYGGAGFGCVELGIVLEEMGRALLVWPFRAAAVMTTSLLLSLQDDTARQDYLPALAGGQLIGTVALAEDDGRWIPDSVRMIATQTD